MSKDYDLDVKKLDCLQELRLLVDHAPHHFFSLVDKTIDTSPQAATLFYFFSRWLLGASASWFPCQ